MSYCKICNEPIDIHKTVQQRRNGICEICHVRYRYCYSCKTHKLRTEFRPSTKNCKDCNIKTKQRRKNRSGIQEIECKQCHKFIRLKNHRPVKFKDEYVCIECKSGIIDDTLVKCRFCKKEFEVLTPNHILNCSSRFSGTFGSCYSRRKKMTYEEYLEKYGWKNIYSGRYRNKMRKLSIEACTDEVKQEIIKKNKDWWNVDDNREKMCKSLKIAQNTDEAKNNHRNGQLNHFKQLSGKELAAKKRRSQEIAFSVIHPIISKPAIIISNKLKEHNITHEMEYAFDFYHIDIAIVEYKIAIEIDGDYWHGNPKTYKTLNSEQKLRQHRDKSKTTYLSNKGWTVLRFWEDDINHNIESCVNSILQQIETCKVKEHEYECTTTW
jgi:very-short-patch-repair endonuclease